jgi:uncharacterized protein (TIGR00725 family)
VSPGTSRDRPYIAVAGAAISAADTDEAAEAVGRELARADAVVLCGGRGGVMDAVARGARAEGGDVVGILPGDDRAEGNEHLSIALATGMGELRNGLLVRACDALIAIGGEFGTLSEIAFALRTGKPVIGLDTWELSKQGRVEPAIEEASDPADAVQRALKAVRS